MLLFGYPFNIPSINKVKVIIVFFFNIVWYLNWHNVAQLHFRGGLREISCQAEKQPERKDAHRKPLLPNLTGS